MTEPGWTLTEMAQMVADDLPRGAYVNLGIGMPNLVASAEHQSSEVLYHSENGVLGVGPRTTVETDGPSDLIDAGKHPTTLVQGASFFGHIESFTMIRGGRIDIAVMGAYQVSETGDLANWWTGDSSTVPAVGGAMDLAYGAARVWVMCHHTSRDGVPKIVERCSYPLTGVGCVKRVYTDLAVMQITDAGVVLERRAPGVSVEQIERTTACNVLIKANDMATTQQR